jgi:hypothetical protein
MTEISSPFSGTSLLSPRTASYVEALIREGDNFDYSSWLGRVRTEEVQAKRATATFSVLAESNNLLGASDDRINSLTARSALVTKAASLARPICRSDREGEPPEARLTRRLEKVCDAWNDFQSSRARDAVYGYLARVFAIVEHYKVRRKTSKLLRHAFEFADLPFDKNADPFTAIIRCTSDNTVDSKMISKWARALRYVARSKKPETGLKTFMKKAGGVNACADLYAQCNGRRDR